MASTPALLCGCQDTPRGRRLACSGSTFLEDRAWAAAQTQYTQQTRPPFGTSEGGALGQALGKVTEVLEESGRAQSDPGRERGDAIKISAYRHNQIGRLFRALGKVACKNNSVLH